MQLCAKTANRPYALHFSKPIMVREQFFVKRSTRKSYNFLERPVIDISRPAGKQLLSVYIDGDGGKLGRRAITASGMACASFERL